MSELVVQSAELAPTSTLFGTDNPAEVVSRAAAVATSLADLVRKQNLIVRIGQSDYVRVEGWTLLGSMLGVFPVVVWTRPVLSAVEEPIGWEARVEARTRSGEVVGAAEAECLRDERSWKSRDDYALRSMAQTRAVSKALRLPLGFVMQLAGFDPTPADEMVHDQTLAGVPTAVEHPTAPVPQAEEHALEPATPAEELDENGRRRCSCGWPDNDCATGSDLVTDCTRYVAEGLPPVDMNDPDIPFGDAPPVRYITERQRTRLFTIAYNALVPVETIRELVIELTGQESTKLIPAGQVYDAVIAAIQAKGQA